MADKAELTDSQKLIIQHTLGARPEMDKKNYGYRNYYCVSVGSDRHRAVEALEALGMMSAGHHINERRDRYYRATVAGCEAIGLTPKQIKRAFEE